MKKHYEKMEPHDWIRLKKIVKIGYEVKHDDNCKLCGSIEKGHMICSSCINAMMLTSARDKGQMVMDIKKCAEKKTANKLASLIERAFECHAPAAEAETNKKKGKRLDEDTKAKVVAHLEAGWSYGRVAEKFDVSTATAFKLHTKARESVAKTIQ